MKMYQVIEPAIDDVSIAEFEGSHQWKLPGISCTACNETWAVTGISYPSIRLPQTVVTRLLKEQKVVSPNVYLTIQSEILRYFPAIPLMMPGANFGTLKGKLKGHNLTDFVPFNPWTLLITQNSLELLSRQELLNLPNSVSVDCNPATASNIFEFEIWPHGTLLNACPSADNSNCDLCGHSDPGKLPRNPVIHKSLSPHDLDLFRLENFPTVIIASERFVETAASWKLTGIDFRQVETA